MRGELLLFCFFLLFSLCQTISFPSATLNWQTCSLFTPGSDSNSNVINNNVPKQIIPWYQLFYSEIEDTSQSTAINAQCTFLNAKLNWTDSSSTLTTPLFIKKIPSLNPTAKKGNLWLLNDGIGKANTFFEPFIQNFVNILNSKYDIYITDFRGTGRSGLMDCFGVSKVNSRFENFAASEVACRQDLKNRYGTTANLYSLTQAGYDLAFAMNATRDSSLKTVVVAIGSASLWVNRLLTLFPNYVDYVILDSPHSPLSVDIINRDNLVEEAATNFLNLCQNDTFCNSKFAPYGGAYNATVNVLQKNRDYYGGCLGNMYRSDLLTQFMAQSLFYRFNRRLILPIIYRLHRCTREDQNLLTNLQLYLKLQGYAMEFSPQEQQTQQQQTPDVNAPAYDSRALFSHIGLSELSQRPFPSVEEWTSKYENRYPPYLFRLGASPEYAKIANTIAINNTFYTEELQDTFGTYTNGLAILYTNGNPVVNSNAAEEWLSEYPFATSVYLPNQMHNLLLTSTKMNNTANTTCGFDIISDILLQVADSTGGSINLATTCLMNSDTSLDEKTRIQYQIPMDYQTYVLLNHGDFWEGGPAMASIDIVRLVVALITIGLIGAFFVGVIIFIIVFLLVVYRIAKRGM